MHLDQRWTNFTNVWTLFYEIIFKVNEQMNLHQNDIQFLNWMNENSKHMSLYGCWKVVSQKAQLLEFVSIYLYTPIEN